MFATASAYPQQDPTRGTWPAALFSPPPLIHHLARCSFTITFLNINTFFFYRRQDPTTGTWPAAIGALIVNTAGAPFSSPPPPFPSPVRLQPQKQNKIKTKSN